MTGTAAAKRALAVLLALVGGGCCFHYVPTELGQVPVGQDVRVRLAQLGVAANLPGASTDEGAAVSGRVVANDAATLLLRVPVAVQQDGLVSHTLGQQITIPVGEILEVRRRELNQGRTRLTVAGGLIALAAGAVSFGKGRSNPEPRPREEEVELRGVAWAIRIFGIQVP